MGGRGKQTRTQSSLPNDKSLGAYSDTSLQTPFGTIDLTEHTRDKTPLVKRWTTLGRQWPSCQSLFS